MRWKYLDCTIASSRWRLVHRKSPDTNITLSVQTQVHCHSKMCKLLPCLRKETTRTVTQPARADTSHGTRWTWPTFLLSALSRYDWSHLSPVVSPHLLSALPLSLTCFLYLFHFLATKEHLHLKLNRTSWFTLLFHLWLCLKWCSTWNKSNFPNYSETSKRLIYKIDEVSLKAKRILK